MIYVSFFNTEKNVDNLLFILRFTKVLTIRNIFIILDKLDDKSGYSHINIYYYDDYEILINYLTYCKVQNHSQSGKEVIHR